MPVKTIEPTVTTEEAETAKADADRIAAPILMSINGKEDRIGGSRLRTWLTFAPTADGGYDVNIDTSALDGGPQEDRQEGRPGRGERLVSTQRRADHGVTKSQTGYKLDLEATRKQVEDLLDARPPARPHALEPTLKTLPAGADDRRGQGRPPEDAQDLEWTTYFPIGEKNGFGANIWIPARLINGYVVAPGATFDFWKAVGPVTRAKGYKSGGRDHQRPDRAAGRARWRHLLVLDDAVQRAARAGYKMLARRNHYYYIDRYPVGLDATVFISASGSKQTMSFTNDTDYPLLIRGFGWRNGGAGYVRFEIYSVPNGRKVTFATGPKRNYRYATDTVQYTSSLPAGVGEADRVPGRRVPGIGDADRPRPLREGHPPRHVVLELRAITGITLVGR